MNGGNDVLTVKNLTINGESGDIGLGIMLGAGADVLHGKRSDRELGNRDRRRRRK